MTRHMAVAGGAGSDGGGSDGGVATASPAGLGLGSAGGGGGRGAGGGTSARGGRGWGSGGGGAIGAEAMGAVGCAGASGTAAGCEGVSGAGRRLRARISSTTAEAASSGHLGKGRRAEGMGAGGDGSTVASATGAISAWAGGGLVGESALKAWGRMSALHAGVEGEIRSDSARNSAV